MIPPAPNSAAEPIIELENVTKSYGGLPVLRSVYLSVPKGCLYGVIGPGASGKSVLLKTMAGLVRADAGHVRVEGKDLGALSDIELQTLRLRYGMLFQNNALFDHMTVGANIAFPLKQLGALSDEEITARVEARLDAVRLGGFSSRMPAGLSGGQKKRVGVARATITQAPVILYDEPAAGLDPVTSQKIFDLLRTEQRATGATVVMVSSDLDRLLTVTDHVAMLFRGRIIFDGTTEEAKSSIDPYVRQFVHGLVDGPL